MGEHYVQAAGARSSAGGGLRPPAVTPRDDSWPVSVAPMMDRSDRHFRVFMRALTSEALLYTEMITTGAVLHGDRTRLLAFSEIERPLALQLGGEDPSALAECTAIAADLGFDEVNLNVGCPSPRVQRGRFGACLMAEPDTVARAVVAMKAASRLPVTVKHRIGIDDLDRYRDLARFVAVVATVGVDGFIVHARKAWLEGLSPKQNRTVPPLRHDDVYRLKSEFPDVRIETNGGVTDLDQVDRHLEAVDGVMIGRAAYEMPYLFADVDRRYYGMTAEPPSRREVVARLLPYLELETRVGTPLARVSRHLLGLFNGLPGAKAWRRHLSQHSHLSGAGVEVVQEALERVPPQALDRTPTDGLSATPS